MNNDINLRKVVIIGDGLVGSSIAFSLVNDSDATDIVLIDIDFEKVVGDVMDLSHASTFSYPKNVFVGNYADIKDAHIIIITAGVNQKEGESRLDLIDKNKAIISSIAFKMRPYLNDRSIVLMVTNPVDVLTYHISNLLDLPKSQVIGSGTVLDTARLKYLLSRDTKVDARNIHAFVVGEHGDSELIPFSLVTIGGIPLLNYCMKCGNTNCDNTAKLQDIAANVKYSAYEIIKRKGSTYYGVAAAVSRIVDAILKNSYSILTVSTYIDSAFDYKINDVYMSIPSIITSSGVKSTLWPNYTKEEKNLLIKSAENIAKYQK